MAIFSCFAAGENFPGALIGVSTPIGFFVNVMVEATDRQDAELKALMLLRDHSKLKLPDDATLPSDAIVKFEVISELPHRPKMGVSGFSFFEMET